MDLSANPFRPGAGRVPAVLAGRAALLSEFRTRLYRARESGEGERPWILSGLRGVGKTVLLNQLGRDAADLKLIFVKVEASRSQPLAAALAKELYLALRRLLLTSDRARALWSRAASVLNSFQVRVDPSGTYSFAFDIEPERGVADSGDLAVDLQELLETVGLAAREANSVLILAVDELQEASTEDLAALNVALHNLGQDVFPVPVVFVGARLPSLPAVLADATSYAERLYDYRQIGLLDTAATMDALTGPARAHGVAWDVDALDSAVTATGGYPYFIQACGSHVWSVRATDIISLDDARIGIEAARIEVEQGLYQSRWGRATPTQRAFMSAMAVDDDAPSSMAELVTRLQKKRTTDLSVNRRDLIRSGHIYTPERGYVAFTVPGMSGFIVRQSD
ncbi:ATP-binding protein [Cryobacterium sp. Hh38]|uniref:ATP-binding protein n=1 Tax=Cryobacterium sp. Hh38 TaxID=1259156 RepID=UPI0010690C22|nr:ATP-binding protein [Cryobacterium sp. Hh38]TFD61839.1 ATP-binding protein [Cryobacterium sp. Hh38]